MSSTPLYRIFYRYKNLEGIIQVKDESKNDSGSIKIRPARYIIKKAYERKEINKDTTLCEVTSGNMGIALAYVAREYGNKMIVCMPKFMSMERRQILESLGVKLILTDSFKEAFQIAKDLKEKENVFLTKQFENIDNAASYLDLCLELEEETKDFPAFIAGVGTGGTLNGVGHFLKKKYGTKVYGLEPKQTLILSTGYSHGPHRIEGLSDGFVPKLYPRDIVDEIIAVDDTDAIVMAQKLRKELGLHVGISSGANFLGAILTNVNNIITVLPDGDEKYYSTDLFNDKLKSVVVDDITLIKIEKTGEKQ